MHITSYDGVNPSPSARGRTYHTDGRLLAGVWGCSGNNSGYRFAGIARAVDVELLERFLEIQGVYSVTLDEKCVEIWIREEESWDPIHAKLEELIGGLQSMPDPPPWR